MQNVKRQRIEILLESMFISVTLGIYFGLMCGGSASWESDLHVLQCEEVSDSQLKAHHSQ